MIILKLILGVGVGVDGDVGEVVEVGVGADVVGDVDLVRVQMGEI